METVLEQCQQREHFYRQLAFVSLLALMKKLISSRSALKLFVKCFESFFSLQINFFFSFLWGFKWWQRRIRKEKLLFDGIVKSFKWTFLKSAWIKSLESYETFFSFCPVLPFFLSKTNISGDSIFKWSMFFQPWMVSCWFDGP